MTPSIRQIHPVFVGEVTGVDISRPLSLDEVAAIEAGMDRYAVLVFPDQKEAMELVGRLAGGVPESCSLEHGRSSRRPGRSSAAISPGGESQEHPPHTGTDRGPGAAGGDERDSQSNLQLAIRCPARVRDDRAEREASLRWTVLLRPALCGGPPPFRRVRWAVSAGPGGLSADAS